MVPHDGEGRLNLSKLKGLLASGGGVVDLGAALQSVLKFPAVFSNVVQLARQLGLLTAPEGPGKGFGQCGSALQMLLYRLHSLPVLRNVGKKDFRLGHDESPPIEQKLALCTITILPHFDNKVHKKRKNCSFFSLICSWMGP